jgi:excinuclease ABC subunit C
MQPDSLKTTIALLPEKPGIYKFFDDQQMLIYVGKAKNIKKRVSSYFNKINFLDNKTKRLVSNIRNIEYTIVDNEFDAYLLENNLIKSHQPKYNILLKDDKTYPYIYVSNERFPRIISTRKVDRSLGKYYGPYTSVKAMNTIIDLIRKLYTLRTCNYNLSEKNIEEKKFKICLEYHIRNCKGPCEGLVDEREYNQNIEQVHHILKGNIFQAKNYFKEEMNKAAMNLEFEKAQMLKAKLELLDKFHSGTIIVNPNISNLEVFTILSNEAAATINYFKINNGTILYTKCLEIKKKLNESDEELLALAIVEIRSQFDSTSTEIITNTPIDITIKDVNISVPSIGDKKKLINLSLKNNLYLLNKPKEDRNKDNTERILTLLQSDLQLKSLPCHIECFDNSNFQGTNPVAAMVCFRNARPAKKEYRHYNIKTVEGPNDFDSMYEIVHRRYKRCLEEALPLPDLIIVDGGKGQLSAACGALTDLKLYGEIPIIGIAKRLEEIYYPADSHPLYIDKKSESLKLLQQIRNEAHRFAITFHRNKRSKNTFDSQLLSIKGIGKNSMEKLLKEFKSLKNIKEASLEELSAHVGKDKAMKVIEEIKKREN